MKNNSVVFPKKSAISLNNENDREDIPQPVFLLLKNILTLQQNGFSDKV